MSHEHHFAARLWGLGNDWRLGQSRSGSSWPPRQDGGQQSGWPDLLCVPTLSQYVLFGRKAETPEDHEQVTMTNVRLADLGRPSFTRLTAEDPAAGRRAGRPYPGRNRPPAGAPGRTSLLRPAFSMPADSR